MSEPVPVGVPPHQGAHAGEPRNADYGYDLTLICRPTKNPGGPWHVTGAVLKHGRDPATWLPGYVDPEFGTEDADTLLQYLEERHGGNGYTLDSLWYWINRPEDAPSLIDHYNQAIQFNGLNPSAAAVTPIVQATARGTESAVETVPNNSTLESRNASHDSEGAGFPTVRVVRVVRVGPPPWAAEFDSVDASELGGQPEWHFATPWLFQALASPTAYRPILAPPGPNDPLEHRCAYWTGAMYLLLYRLGWADPAAGLEWWRHAGYPSDDPTLRLIKATWLRDGRLSRLEP